jgi:hypothetical protein
MNSTVFALAAAGGDLYAGGDFSTAGGTAVNYIASGTEAVGTSVGSGLDFLCEEPWLCREVNCMRGDTYTSRVRGALPKWNGSNWTPLGSGVNSNVSALAVSGSDLYVGGSFTTAGGIAAKSIAKWNGSTWTALGSGMVGGVYSPIVFSLAVSGSDVYAVARLLWPAGTRPLTSPNGMGIIGRA